MALTILDEEKCPKCGVPTWHAYSEDSTVAFEMDSITCYACAYKDEQEKDKDEEPGVTKFVRAVPEDGCDELPNRMMFYEHMMKKHGAVD